MKFLIRYGWIILLLGVTACGTATPMSPVEVQMTSMAAQAQACATLQAIGTPYPCNPPTATSTPQPTPTMVPSPTATPYSGWKQFTEDGQFVADMPPGFEPPCEGVVGCPGKLYIQYVNGVPVSGDQGGTTGTPGYWPWLLVGIPVALAFFLIIGIGVYGATAPQRALAKSIELVGKAQAKLLEMSGMQPSLPAPKDVKAHVVWSYIQRFIKAYNPDPQFEPFMRQRLSAFRRDDLVPLGDFAAWVHQFDADHETNVVEAYSAFAEKVDITAIEKRS
ncbi:hypothetical protein KJZ67_02660 [Patescibacteria group bacterium]|nr:hypothetical protein [Patescibacteria group bacterium]